MTLRTYRYVAETLERLPAHGPARLLSKRKCNKPDRSRNRVKKIFDVMANQEGQKRVFSAQFGQHLSLVRVSAEGAVQ